MSPEGRFQTIQKNSLCTNCLSNQHRRDTCPSSKRCQVCNGFHHTTLHNPAKQFNRTHAAFTTSNVQQQTKTAGQQNWSSKDDNNSQTQKSIEATQNKLTQFKPKSNLRYGKNFGNNNNQQSSKRANLNGPSTSQNFNVNQISSTPKYWFERLQLLPVSFVKEDKVFDTYALIDPGSQFTFLLDAVSDYLELPREYQSSTTVQYLSVDYEMPLSKIKQPITVCPFNQFDEKFQISRAYSTPTLNVNAANVTELNYVCDAFNELRHIYFPDIAEGKIGALLGVNAFAFTHPTEVIQGTEIRPFGVKTKLGWTLAGEYLNTLGNCSSKSSNKSKVFVYHVCRKSPEQPLDNLIQEFWSIENDGTRKEDNTITEDEKSAIRILESTINHTGERYEIGLPWKVPANLQNNYFSALNQLNSLNKRLNNDPKLSDMYQQTLVTDLEKNYVKPVEMTDPPPEKIWYLPHHPVQSANKPNKVRRVANAASKFKGESLNSNLLTGPDLLNSLIGILVRFREKPIAILADIEGMFMQIGIRNEDQSALRFLWSIDNDVRQFQFTRLIFGATCSPSCAIFVLNRCAEDNVETYPKAQSAIKLFLYG